MRKLGLLALICMLSIGGAAFAQDAAPVFCGTLAAADCTILTNAQTATQTLDSLSFDLTFNETASNLPQMTEPMIVNVSGNGSLSGLTSLRNDATAMMAGSTVNPMPLFQDIMTKLSADVTLNLNLPPKAGSTTPNNFTVQVRLVNGIGYINFDTLPAEMNHANITGWGAINMGSLLPVMMQRMPDMMSNMNDSMGMMHDMMQQFNNPDFLRSFISVQRTDNGSGSTANFEFTVDLGTLASSPEFQTMMQTQMQGQTQDSGMSKDQMQQAMEMQMQMMQGATAVVDEEIGLSDSFVHSIHVQTNVDMSAMMAMMSNHMGTATPVANSNGLPPTISVDFTVNFSNFNNAPAIIAPPNATTVTAGQLLGINANATAEATDEMTPVPPTSEPTEEMTVEPTMEVTMEPTVEVTAEPTVEVTPMPTVEVTLPVPAPTVEVTAGA